jgi:4-amino-4-deoxy-L-arabinose transferase-like glycosyltransferase
MNSAYLWGNTLPLATFIASLGLLFFALFKKWPVEVPSTELPDNPAEDIPQIDQGPLRERIKGFIVKYRWELILGATIAAILLFALIFAPPRLNGNIAVQPNSPGRPFYNLRWVRTFLYTYYDTIRVWAGALSSSFCLTLLAWVILKRSGFGAQFVLLCSSLNLAGAAQWLLHDESTQLNGKILYIIAMYGFAMWAWAAHERLVQNLEKRPVARRVEVILILGLLLLTSFNRLYTLRTIPYGIEGDEAKWTSEAVNLGIRGVPDSSGEYHRDALPVSYYLQIPLHRLLGPSLFAARLTVVILSIIGTLAFYWLLRQITVMPVAAIATYLLSISIFDISASRLANVESFVKIWPILGLALLALAVGMRRWHIFGLSGLAIALGMLTYDTVWPLFGVVVIIAFIELARQRENRHTSTSAIAALIAPTLLALPVLIPYLTSRLAYYEFDKKGLNIETGSILAEYSGNVIRTWFVSLQTDFLYNRPGPLLNALILPLLVLGVVIAFSLIKKKISYWTLLWAGLVIFPVPILANSPMGRIYYPALPAVYTLVALGIFFLWQEINRFFGANLRPLVIAVILVPLIWLPFANLFIYFNEVYDADDRRMRREIGEFAAQAADEGALILLPATSGLNTPLNNEYQMLELYMMQKLPASEVKAAYLYLAPENLLSSIESKAANYQKIEVIFDKIETESIAETLQLCYPHGKITEGEYFSRFSLSKSASGSKNCSLATLELELIDDNNLNWKLSDGRTQRLELLCEVRQSDYEWLEMEDLFMGNGWQTEIEFASGWSGTGFAMDNNGSGPLLLDISPEQPQNNYIWVRYFKRTIDESSVYLSIDNNPHPIADVQEADLYSWKWERIGPVNIDVDSEVSINHTFDGDPRDFMAIFIDSLVTTSDSEFTPDTDLWESTSPNIFSFTQPQASGTIRLDLPPESYRCKVASESDIPVINMLGNTSSYVTSNIIEFDTR